jgi:nicotinamidase-related amidase
MHCLICQSHAGRAVERVVQVLEQATADHINRVTPAHPTRCDAKETMHPKQNGHDMISDKLLTPKTSAVLLVDYQQHVIDGIHSTDLELIELNGQALARAAKTFDVPVVLSTIGVGLRGDHPTIASVRLELPDEPEYDRNTMNAWDDDAFREAVERTGRRRLVFAGLWTEVCLLYPVLHAQREGFETYFVVDAVGGATITAHETAIQRMIQAGSQPVTLASLLLEWVRDWKTSPHAEGFYSWADWYGARIAPVQERLRTTPFVGGLA